jgi:hypothetical protein
MTRKLVVLLALGLVFAPVASAKGPHAVITSVPEGLVPGKPWVATLELNEFRRTPHPLVIATRGDRRVTARIRPVAASMVGAAGFRLRMVFPTEGRWRLAVVAGKRRFAFPALAVGSGAPPQDYVAFPAGSEAARQGTALPPEVVSVPQSRDEDQGLALWIPALGLALAGAGVYRLRTRR